MKQYEILFKFSDVSIGIEARSLKEAQKKAQKILEGEDKEINNPHEDTYCYDFEIEESD